MQISNRPVFGLTIAFVLSTCLLVGGLEYWGHVKYTNMLPLFLSQVQRDETIRRGNIIAQALERYRSVHGDYQTSLEALSPATLSRVEPPAIPDYNWRYRYQPGLMIRYDLTVMFGPKPDFIPSEIHFYSRNNRTGEWSQTN